MLIRIIPVGDLPEKILESLIAEMPLLLNAKARLMPGLQLPEETMNRLRRQYDAEKIMSILSRTHEAKFIDKEVPTLFITEADIYYAGLNFVFGLEDPEKRCAIISLARLKQEFYDGSPNLTVLADRTVKEAVHEIGHYLGLDHCGHSWCVMNFSPSVSDVDAKQKTFCKDCKVKLAIAGRHNI